MDQAASQNQGLLWDQPERREDPALDRDCRLRSGRRRIDDPAKQLILYNFGKARRIYNWSFNIQHEVKNFVVDIAYVGNRGHGLNSTIELNQLPVSALQLGTLLQRPISSPEVVAAGYKKPYPAFPDNQTLAQALRPYPQYFGVLDRNSGAGQTWYDSLQTKVERRFGTFQLMASHTWSKSLAANHYRQIFSQHFNVGAHDAYNLNDMKALLPFDQPHILNALWTLELQFGKGSKWLNSPGFVNAYTIPGQFELGSAATYDSAFRQPPVFSENISLAKRIKFPITADRTVDLFYQANAFNLLNRTNFGGIVATVGNANFGRPTGPQLGARLITMVLRLEF